MMQQREHPERGITLEQLDELILEQENKIKNFKRSAEEYRKQKQIAEQELGSLREKYNKL